jgi:hypothetical protein
MTESEATTVEAAENAIAAKEPPKAITPELFVSISPHFRSADSGRGLPHAPPCFVRLRFRLSDADHCIDQRIELRGD